jgi:hypothetical protein
VPTLMPKMQLLPKKLLPKLLLPKLLPTLPMQLLLGGASTLPLHSCILLPPLSS